MTASPAALESFRRAKDHFVGFDSDGCVFDSMELKHKECFIPNTIRHYELQPVSSLARETWEFVNLYSRSRGVNRFPALVQTLRLLAERPRTRQRGVSIRDTSALERFVGSGKPLGNPSLKEALAATGDSELERALHWSEDVNRDVARMVHGLPPFPFARECLEASASFADTMCVSSTPLEALAAEWKEHDIARHVRLIVGQEIASKKDVIRKALAFGYDPARILVVGDAPGDLQAATASGGLFFPIVPGDEDDSWRLLHEEGLPRFREGSYGGAFQKGLVERFLERLPETPPWRR